MKIFLVFTVIWFLYAFFRFWQELFRGLGNTGPVETGPAIINKGEAKEPVPGAGKRYS